MMYTANLPVYREDAIESEEDIRRITEALLSDDDFYGEDVRVLKLNIADNGNLSGDFQDSENKRVFEFSIKNGDISYKPRIKGRRDSVDWTDERTILQWDVESKIYSKQFPEPRFDAKKRRKVTKKPKCGGTSYNCGYGCVNVNLNCRIKKQNSKSAQRVKKLEELAKQYKSGNAGSRYAKSGNRAQDIKKAQQTAYQERKKQRATAKKTGDIDIKEKVRGPSKQREQMVEKVRNSEVEDKIRRGREAVKQRQAKKTKSAVAKPAAQSKKTSTTPAFKFNKKTWKDDLLDTQPGEFSKKNFEIKTKDGIELREGAVDKKGRFGISENDLGQNVVTDLKTGKEIAKTGDAEVAKKFATFLGDRNFDTGRTNDIEKISDMVSKEKDGNYIKAYPGELSSAQKAAKAAKTEDRKRAAEITERNQIEVAEKNLQEKEARRAEIQNHISKSKDKLKSRINENLDIDLPKQREEMRSYYDLDKRQSEVDGMNALRDKLKSELKEISKEFKKEEIERGAAEKEGRKWRRSKESTARRGEYTDKLNKINDLEKNVKTKQKDIDKLKSWANKEYSPSMPKNEGPMGYYDYQARMAKDRIGNFSNSEKMASVIPMPDEGFASDDLPRKDYQEEIESLKLRSLPKEDRDYYRGAKQRLAEQDDLLDDTLREIHAKMRGQMAQKKTVSSKKLAGGDRSTEDLSPTAQKGKEAVEEWKAEKNKSSDRPTEKLSPTAQKGKEVVEKRKAQKLAKGEFQEPPPSTFDLIPKNNESANITKRSGKSELDRLTDGLSSSEKDNFLYVAQMMDRTSSASIGNDMRERLNLFESIRDAGVPNPRTKELGMSSSDESDLRFRHKKFKKEFEDVENFAKKDFDMENFPEHLRYPLSVSSKSESEKRKVAARLHEFARRDRELTPDVSLKKKERISPDEVFKKERQIKEEKEARIEEQRQQYAAAEPQRKAEAEKLAIQKREKEEIAEERRQAREKRAAESLATLAQRKEESQSRIKAKAEGRQRQELETKRAIAKQKRNEKVNEKRKMSSVELANQVDRTAVSSKSFSKLFDKNNWLEDVSNISEEGLKKGKIESKMHDFNTQSYYATERDALITKNGIIGVVGDKRKKADGNEIDTYDIYENQTGLKMFSTDSASDAKKIANYLDANNFDSGKKQDFDALREMVTKEKHSYAPYGIAMLKPLPKKKHRSTEKLSPTAQKGKETLNDKQSNNRNLNSKKPFHKTFNKQSWKDELIETDTKGFTEREIQVKTTKGNQSKKALITKNGHYGITNTGGYSLPEVTHVDSGLLVGKTSDFSTAKKLANFLEAKNFDVNNPDDIKTIIRSDMFTKFGDSRILNVKSKDESTSQKQKRLEKTRVEREERQKLLNEKEKEEVVKQENANKNRAEKEIKEIRGYKEKVAGMQKENVKIAKAAMEERRENFANSYDLDIHRERLAKLQQKLANTTDDFDRRIVISSINGAKQDIKEIEEWSKKDINENLESLDKWKKSHIHRTPSIYPYKRETPYGIPYSVAEGYQYYNKSFKEFDKQTGIYTAHQSVYDHLQQEQIRKGYLKEEDADFSSDARSPQEHIADMEKEWRKAEEKIKQVHRKNRDKLNPDPTENLSSTAQRGKEAVEKRKAEKAKSTEKTSKQKANIQSGKKAVEQRKKSEAEKSGADKEYAKKMKARSEAQSKMSRDEQVLMNARRNTETLLKAAEEAAERGDIEAAQSFLEDRKINLGQVKRIEEKVQSGEIDLQNLETFQDKKYEFMYPSN